MQTRNYACSSAASSLLVAGPASILLYGADMMFKANLTVFSFSTMAIASEQCIYPSNRPVAGYGWSVAFAAGS